MKTPQGQPHTPVLSRHLGCYISAPSPPVSSHTGRILSHSDKCSNTAFPINKRDLFLPGAIIQPHLSLFLCISNGRDATADASRGIHYRNHLEGFLGLGSLPVPGVFFNPGKENCI